IEDLLKQLLGHSVDVGSRFIENQNLRISQNSAHERDDLSLAQAYAVAGRSDLGLKPLLETRKQTHKVSLLQQLENLFIGVFGVLFVAVKHIVANGSGKQERILKDESNRSRTLVCGI